MDIFIKHLKNKSLFWLHQRANDVMDRIIHVTDAFFTLILCSIIILVLSVDDIFLLGLLYFRVLDQTCEFEKIHYYYLNLVNWTC